MPKPSTIKEFINNIKNNDTESLDNAYNKMFPEFKKKKENKKKNEDIFIDSKNPKRSNSKNPKKLKINIKKKNIKKKNIK